MKEGYLDKEELAAAFGVSLTTATNWVRRGCPYEERGGKGRPWKFSLPKVLDWHRQYHGGGDRDRDTTPPDEVPDIIKRRPDYMNPLRGIPEDFAKGVFHHWITTYCQAFLVIAREQGLSREASFRLFQHAVFLHSQAIVDAVSEDHLNQAFASSGGIDEVWFQLGRSNERLTTSPPPNPGEQIQFAIPEWVGLKPHEFVAQHWTDRIDELAEELANEEG